jgi:hypothetical protein
LRTNWTVGIGLSLALLATAKTSAAENITVNAGGDLQAAINTAQPGDTIYLQAGASFTGSYHLPAKGGTSYITIRSSAPDTSLPKPGERITPAYASLLPKIKVTNVGPGIKTDRAATYWRLQFLEILPASSMATANLVEFGGAGTSQNTLSSVPQHLILDHCYLHGDPNYGQRRGLALNSGDTQIVNSYFADFKGVSQDTQAIMGWNGPGPFLIENNYLEAAAENLMFGGTDPTIPNLVPSNITIRRNVITKKTAWKTQSWTVKNLIEFKNAQHVVLEGNTIENNWAAGQQGYSILFTPRNQSGTAPWTVVRDITVQHNIIRHVASGFNISGYDDSWPSQQTQNIEIKNNLMYDVSTYWSTPYHPAHGWLAVIGGGPKNITFDHNTVDNNGNATIFFDGNPQYGIKKIYGFEVTNNLLRDNTYGIYGNAIGEGTVGLNAYTPNYVVLRNTFAGPSAKLYPTGNDFPTLLQWKADVKAVADDYHLDAVAANYHLVSTSLSKRSGTDGKDLGVDFAALNAALNGSATPSPEPPPPSTGDSKPYTGTPVALPGYVQFENYDAGGSMVAYYDTTSGNTGGAYRSNNVDVQATTDVGGGYNLAWVKATEWLKYTVNIAAAGSYSIDVRVASNGAGGTFHIEVDGANATGPISVPNTAGWQMWQTITKTGVSLPAGTHVLRVVMDANGATGSIGNLNWFAVR